MNDLKTRREVLKVVGATGLALAVSASLDGCATGGRKESDAASMPSRVIVVGGGFGGLACAYELHKAGVDVVVLEARGRVGGRVLTLPNVLPNGTVEGGGELIGDNHPTWIRYRDELGLKFLDVTENEDLEVPILLRGRRLSAAEGKTLYKDMEEVLSHITADARTLNIDAERPWLTPNAAELDRGSLADGLASLSAPELAVYATRVQLESNNGMAAERQSYLGVLTQVKAGGLDKYWTSSETHRCAGGNQQLAERLAAALPAEAVVRNTRVTAIEVREDGVRVTLGDGREMGGTHVVLAMPPSVWGGIRILPGLPAALTGRAGGGVPQMGTAIKYLRPVDGRFWEPKISPDAFGDQVINQTWDGTDGQTGSTAACLVGFSGGREARHYLELVRAAGRESPGREALQQFYPDLAGHVLGKDVLMDWPNEAFTRAGYSFPAPGQIVRQGELLYGGVHGGRVRFAGEHCCYGFAGYMEGALNSGRRVGLELAGRESTAAAGLSYTRG